ncbi:hypothetical protein MTR67_039852 [Solanum verrucosum]|uniref:PCI domain-containing protein n=1 Tax=Solanum verrucosum TaxID=315347 RepID=A0AAF0UI71_SOLVR|nr:hypothetical protein MTR67_039852 [Solanum verrucosum]
MVGDSFMVFEDMVNEQLPFVCLFNLYNLLENPYSRFFVYMKALNLAINGKVVEHILPSFKKIDSFLKEWNLGVKDDMGLFLKISNIMKKTKGSAKESFKFLIQYLGAFLDEDASIINEKEEALHAIIAFVKAPDMFQILNCQMLSFPMVCQYIVEHFFWCIGYVPLLACNCIGQLEKDAKHALAYHEVSVVGGLLHEDCVEKMRLLTLVDLVKTKTGQIPYSMIKATLNVESWVVKVISAMLLSCKIDQMNQVITVRQCTEHVFGTNQWQLLRAKLVTWKVSHILLKLYSYSQFGF